MTQGRQFPTQERFVRLENGQTFPDLTVETVGDGPLRLPQDLGGSWSVLLFYRGGWCPYCQAQLASFERRREEFADNDIRLVALSVDTEEDATATVEDMDLGFPVAWGLDVDDVAATLGAYRHRDPDYLESTGFVLDGVSRIQTMVYSSNAIGRFTPADTLGFVDYHRA